MEKGFKEKTASLKPLLPNHTCRMIANCLKFRVFPRPGQDLGPPKGIAIATLKLFMNN